MGRSKVILDANIYIAYYIVNDSCHKEALFVFDLIDKDDIILPYCIILEVCNVLCAKAGKKAADHFLSDISNSNKISIINDDVLDEIRRFLSISEKLSFTDTSLLLLSEKETAELITFDKQLLRLYKKTKTR